MENKTAKNNAIFQKLPPKRPEFQVSEFLENLPGIFGHTKKLGSDFGFTEVARSGWGPCWGDDMKKWPGGGFTKMPVNNRSSRENIDINVKKSKVAHEVTIVTCSHEYHEFHPSEKSVEKKTRGFGGAFL